MSLMTVDDAAKFLAVSTTLIRREIARGKLRCYRLGRAAIRFSEEQLQDYLQSSEIERGPGRAARLPRLKHLKV